MALGNEFSEQLPSELMKVFTLKCILTFLVSDKDILSSLSFFANKEFEVPTQKYQVHREFVKVK